MESKKNKSPKVLGLKIDTNAIGWALVEDWFLGFPLPEFDTKSKKGYVIQDDFITDNTEEPTIVSKVLKTENMEEIELIADEILKARGKLLCAASKDGKFFIYSDAFEFKERKYIEDVAQRFSERIRKTLDYYIDNLK